MHVESENKFGFLNFFFFFVWLLFSNGSYLKNEPRKKVHQYPLVTKFKKKELKRELIRSG